MSPGFRLVVPGGPTLAPEALRRRDLLTLAALLLIAAAAVRLVQVPTGGAPASSAVPWPVLGVLAMLLASVHVLAPLGQHHVELTVLDAVLAAGLWVTRPDELVVAIGTGVGLQLVLVGRIRGRALVLNLAVLAVHLLSVRFVFDHLAGAVMASPGHVVVGPTVVATTVGAVVALFAVAIVAMLEDGRAALEGAWTTLLATLALSSSSAALGALAAGRLLAGRADWGWAALPLAGLLFVAVAAARARRRAAGLAGGMDAVCHIHASSDETEARRRLLTELSRRFGADGVELVRVPPDGGTPSRTELGDLSWGGELFGWSPTPVRTARLHARGRGGMPGASGMSTCVEMGAGEMVVRVVRGPWRQRYGRVDLDVFREVCNAAAGALEASRMSATLRRLEELDDMKTAFLTAVSHDLRTPLSVVLAGTATLSTHGDRIPEETRHVLLDRMGVQGRRLEQMLTDLLDVDRLQRGILQPVRSEVDLGTLVAEVVEGMDDASHPVRLPTASVTADVDPGHVARIVENLVRNAIKYTPPGTPIWIDVRRDAHGAQLVVSDAGPGVPEGQRTAIFDAFVRGDDAHPSPGTGVGLDLVRRLAELHGGSSWVDERPGGGARFWVTLPTASPRKRAADPPRPAARRVATVPDGVLAAAPQGHRAP